LVARPSTDPGINGPTSLAAIRNADAALGLIEATLKSLRLYDNTNIIVAADHGFSTIVKTGSNSTSVKGAYSDVKSGELPPGFLAIDLYEDLNTPGSGLKLFDPDAAFRQVDWVHGIHPTRGNGLIGKDADHPDVVVAANGGSDLIYLPTEPPAWQRRDRSVTHSHSAADRQRDRALASRVVGSLLKHNYVSGIFINEERFGLLPGALSLSSIGLVGHAVTPKPDIVVNFASRIIPGCALGPTLCAEEFADTSLVEGQGMHGSFSRADTLNFMAARGPDFKTGFLDEFPSSNADVGMTIAKLLGLGLPSKGTLKGRVLTEALRTDAAEELPKASARTIQSKATAGGLETVLKIQILGEEIYFDAAGFPGRTVGLE
jgi:hypothetical protein